MGAALGGGLRSGCAGFDCGLGSAVGTHDAGEAEAEEKLGVRRANQTHSGVGTLAPLLTPKTRTLFSETVHLAAEEGHPACLGTLVLLSLGRRC